MFKNNKFEIMYFNKRIAYFKDYDEQKPSLNPPFSSVYICHNVLPRQIVFEELKKKVKLGVDFVQPLCYYIDINREQVKH